MVPAPSRAKVEGSGVGVNAATNTSRLPTLGPPNAPYVVPVSNSSPDGPMAMPFPVSYAGVPNCIVHSRMPSPSYLATYASLLPAFGPAKLPSVPPVMYAFPLLSTATAFSESPFKEPICLTQARFPASSNLQRKPSLPPALVPPNEPGVVPATKTLPEGSTAMPPAPCCHRTPRFAAPKGDFRPSRI